MGIYICGYDARIDALGRSYKFPRDDDRKLIAAYHNFGVVKIGMRLKFRFLVKP